MSGLPYLEYLHQALATPEGLVLETNDVPYVTRKLKEAKLLSLDPAFEVLEIIPSPSTNDQVWILKNAKPSA
jgi:hypothetical protein